MAAASSTCLNLCPVELAASHIVEHLREGVRGSDCHGEGAVETLRSGIVASFLLEKSDLDGIGVLHARRMIEGVLRAVLHLSFARLGCSAAGGNGEGQDRTQCKGSQTQAHIQFSRISVSSRRLARKIYLSGPRCKAAKSVALRRASGF